MAGSTCSSCCCFHHDGIFHESLLCLPAANTRCPAVLFAVGMAVLGTFTSELYATPVRATATAIFNEAGRLGSIIAPLMLMVGGQVNPQNAAFVPFLTFGLTALVAGLLTLVLPETLGAPMAENIDVSGWRHTALPRWGGAVACAAEHSCQLCDGGGRLAQQGPMHTACGLQPVGPAGPAHVGGATLPVGRLPSIFLRCAPASCCLLAAKYDAACILLGHGACTCTIMTGRWTVRMFTRLALTCVSVCRTCTNYCQCLVPGRGSRGSLPPSSSCSGPEQTGQPGGGAYHCRRNHSGRSIKNSSSSSTSSMAVQRRMVVLSAYVLTALARRMQKQTSPAALAAMPLACSRQG